ncbi:MAG: ParA family protein [Nitrospirae bacterium]|nr:ParA family protein [Nitrospirota bacterium]
MGSIIAVANQKGGVGKTTTAINLAASLAVADKKVLLIDVDPQGNTTSGLQGNREGFSASLYDVILGEKKIGDIVLKTELAGLDLIPARVDLVGAELELVQLPQRESLLKKALQDAVGRYDYLILDCPPSLGLLTLNALTAAHSVIVPVQCEYYAMEGLGQLLKTVQRVRESYNPGLKIEGILFTMYDGRTNLSQQVVREVRSYFKQQVFESVVPRNVVLAEAPSHGRPVILYNIDSVGAQAYLSLAREVMTHAEKSAR